MKSIDYLLVSGKWVRLLTSGLSTPASMPRVVSLLERAGIDSWPPAAGRYFEPIEARLHAG